MKPMKKYSINIVGVTEKKYHIRSGNGRQVAVFNSLTMARKFVRLMYGKHVQVGYSYIESNTSKTNPVIYVGYINKKTDKLIDLLNADLTSEASQKLADLKDKWDKVYRKV